MKLLIRTALVAGFLAGMSLPALAKEPANPTSSTAAVTTSQQTGANHGKCGKGKCGHGKCGGNSNSNTKSNGSA